MDTNDMNDSLGDVVRHLETLIAAARKSVAAARKLVAQLEDAADRVAWLIELPESLTDSEDDGNN